MKKNKIFSLLLSIVIALSLWAYVVTTVTPEDSQWIRNIPVTFANEDGLFSDRNLTLTKGRNATVDLKVYGKRQDLLKLSNSNITITADLSTVLGPGEWQLRYNVEMPETVSDNDISIESRSAYEIDVQVDLLSVKEVPVQAVFQGSVAEGYVQDPIELEYDTLEISGPQDQVAQVDHAEVVLERTNLSKTVSDSLSYTFVDADGNEVISDEIHCSVDKIGVMMTVSMVKEIPLTVQLIDGGGATGEHTVSSIEPATITVKGSAEDLEGMNSLNIGNVDLSTVPTNTAFTKSYNIVLPDNMTNMTGEKTAEVTVELKNLKEKTFRVTNLELANTPSNLKATLGTVSLQIKVRGPSDVMEAVTASSIRAVADLSSVGTSTGQFSVPVDVYVDGFSGIGAMGSYNVLVSISEPTESDDTAVAVDVNPSGAPEPSNSPETGDTPEE